jgi:hypothetical protein
MNPQRVYPPPCFGQKRLEVVENKGGESQKERKEAVTYTKQTSLWVQMGLIDQGCNSAALKGEGVHSDETRRLGAAERQTSCRILTTG